MAIHNECHRHLERVHHLVCQQGVLGKLFFEVQVIALVCANHLLNQWMSIADDLLDQMLKVVHKFEGKRRTESDAFSYARGM